MKHKKWLSLLLTVTMALSFVPATVMADGGKDEIEIQTEDTQIVETYTFEDVAGDSDALFEGYVDRKFGISSGNTVSTKKRGGTSYLGDSLTGNDKAAYDAILAALVPVLEGTQTSTKIEINISPAGKYYYYTFDELGVTSDTDSQVIKDLAFARAYEDADFDKNLVVKALLYDHPYEMFWYDKTAGAQIGYATGSGFGDQYIAVLFHWNLYFYVEKAYSATNERGTSVLGPVMGQVNAAVANANTIVANHADESDREKLASYKDEICALTEYNHDALGDNVDYGDPWQMIYVFDGDPDTNVVCEGYSKAFKYLCDQSTFNDPNIGCYIVSGSMIGGIGAGDHMWNMVTLEDGKHYLVDVTNCDGTPGSITNSIGYPDKLFLREFDEKTSIEITQGTVTYTTTLYTYYIDSLNSIEYYYDLETESIYSQDLLAVAGIEEVFEELDVQFKHSCTFDECLAINYYVEVSSLSGYSDIKLVVKNDEIPARKKIVNGTTYYWFQYSGVLAQQMGVQINATLHATKNGVEYASATDHYSVKQYAYNMLRKTGYPDEFYTLLVDMLNYGSSAQKYIYRDSIANSDLVNADLTAEEKNWATSSQPALPQTGLAYTKQSTDTVDFANVSVTLQNSLAVNFFMDIQAGQSTDNLRLECTYTSSYGDQITVKVPFSKFTYDSEAGYKATVNGIAPCDARCIISANVYDGETRVGGTFEVSVAVYAKALLSMYEGDARYENLIYDMMRYCDSAYTFFID